MKESYDTIPMPVFVEEEQPSFASVFFGSISVILFTLSILFVLFVFHPLY